MHIKDVYAARENLKPYLPITPLLYSTLLSRQFGIDVWLKLETQLPTGSLKPRPAFNSILCQLTLARERGVIASSSGNFAQGVALAARELGTTAIIVMPGNTSPYKVDRTKALGAEVVLCGNTHKDRLETTKELQKKTGRLQLEPYDSIETIAGDGTIGLELSEQLGDKLNEDTAILVPVSGGGLLAGISFAVKTQHPKCRMFGIQPKSNGSLKQSLATGQCVNVGPVKTIADALTASSPGETPFKIIQQYCEDVILLEEETILNATQFMIEQHKLVVEPAGAISVAALFSKQVSAKHVVCIISGGNINLWKTPE